VAILVKVSVLAPVNILLAGFLCFSLASVVAAPPRATVSASHKAGFADLISGRKPGPNQVWKLQQHGIVFGDLDVYLSKSGLRTECSRSGIIVIARAPRFDVVAYNMRANAVWKPTLEKFAPADIMLKSLTLAGLPASSKFPLVASGSKEVNGLLCQTYSTTEGWTKQQIDLFQGKRFSDRFPRKAEFLGADLHVPIVVYHILEKIDGVPLIPLVPLNYGYVCLGNSKTTVVVTNNCRIVEAPKDWLKVPEGLKAVSSFQALNMDKAAESGINELFGGLDK